MGTETTDVTGTKKIIVLTLLGVIVVVSILAMFMPDTRAFAAEEIKLFLNAIVGIAK